MGLHDHQGTEQRRQCHMGIPSCQGISLLSLADRWSLVEAGFEEEEPGNILHPGSDMVRLPWPGCDRIYTQLQDLSP